MGDEPRLYRREQLALADAAASLAAGARCLIAACPLRVRVAATDVLLSALRTHDPAWRLFPRTFSDPGLVGDELAHAPDGPVSLTSISFSGDVDAVFAALNWSRDLLRAGDRRFVLWLDGQDEFRTFVARAPDAYSFRDLTIIVEGAPEMVPLGPEPAHITRARRWYDAAPEAEKPAAAAGLAQALFGVNRRASREVARIALDPATGVSPVVHARLVYFAWREGPHAYAVHASALAALADGSDQIASLLASQLWLPPGYGVTPAKGREDAVQAVSLATRGACLTAGHGYPQETATANPHDAIVDRARNGQVLYLSGRWREAEAVFVSCHDMARLAGLADLALSLEREIGSLRLQMGEMPDGGQIDSAFGWLLTAARASSSGQAAAAALAVDRVRLSALEDDSYGAHLSAAGALVQLRMEARAAGLTTLADFHTTDATLCAMEDESIAAFGDDPPWTRILFGLLRARLLKLTDLDAALSLAESALNLAATGAEFLAPEASHTLGRLLVAKGRLDDAIAVVDRWEAVAQRESLFKHREEMQCVRILAHAARGEDLDAPMRALFALFDESGARPFEARLRVELHGELPPLLRAAWAEALAAPALEIARDLPCPELEGRALEALGDRAGAERVYVRYGLEMRRLILARSA